MLKVYNLTGFEDRVNFKNTDTSIHSDLHYIKGNISER